MPILQHYKRLLHQSFIWISHVTLCYIEHPFCVFGCCRHLFVMKLSFWTVIRIIEWFKHGIKLLPWVFLVLAVRVVGNCWIHLKSGRGKPLKMWCFTSPTSDMMMMMITSENNRPKVSDSSPWLNAYRLRSFPCHTYRPACRHTSDLQIGLRVREWVRVRLFNRSSHGLDWHLSHQKRKHTFVLYWSATGRSIGSVDITSLKLESRSRTQSRTRSPIRRSLLTKGRHPHRKYIKRRVYIIFSCVTWSSYTRGLIS